MMEKALFAAGCFWGVEETFRKINGVKKTTVGYSGGILPNPTYEQVCGGKTKHAECVEVEFDPAVITYDLLLDVFWSCHNPTTLNRQGLDVGEQYRSAIFYYTPLQEQLARESKERLEKAHAYLHPIVTQILPAETFYRAEQYHQRYLEKNRFFGNFC